MHGSAGQAVAAKAAQMPVAPGTKVNDWPRKQEVSFAKR